MAMECIMNAFGEAVVDSQSFPDSNTPNSTLRGELNHYTRIGQNWRIVLDDMILTEQQTSSRSSALLHHQRYPKSRNNSTSKAKTENSDGHSLALGQVQVLAYNDM